MARFDPKKPIVLITDASRIGLGFILIQPDNNNEAFDNNGYLITTSPTSYTIKKHPKGKLIMCGSRFISATELHYAIVELEMLALVWAVQKCRLYLAGTRFKVVTDHQPLIGICNGKNLDAVNNVRIQRMLSKTLGYEFRVLYMEGKLNLIADALSRLPVFAAEKDDPDLVCTVRVAKLDETGQMSNGTSDL